MKFSNKNRDDSALQTYPKQSYLKKAVYKTGTTFWTPVNTLFISSSLLVLLASSAGIFSGMFSSFALSSSSSTNEAQDNFYPTSLPWIQDKSDCESRGRTWKDGKCWDQEHSPMF
jgi:hypothetical protein